MLILDTVNRSIEVVLGGAITTSQLTFVSSYVDNTTTSFTPGSNQSTTNSATPVTMVAAPSASTQRQLKYLNIFNSDTVVTTVTVQFNDNSTIRKLVTASLLVGESLIFADTTGWYIIGTSGQIRTIGFNNAAGNDVTFIYPVVPNAGVTTLVTTNSYALFCQTAARSYSQVTIAYRVTTAAGTITWEEAAVLKGDVALGAGANLTTVGSADISGITGTGVKTVTISLSGVNAGDNLWIAFGMQATTALVLRALGNITADSVATGLFLSAAARPSTMGAATAFATSLVLPFWSAQRWT